jgi:N-sulfoglucosamine sulfohydrolase
VPANIDDGPGKAFMLDSGLLKEKRGGEQLFDLYLDPVERINRIDETGYESVYHDLSARLLAWMEQAENPLLNGKVSATAGAKVNRLSCISPKLNDFE